MLNSLLHQVNAETKTKLQRLQPTTLRDVVAQTMADYSEEPLVLLKIHSVLCDSLKVAADLINRPRP